MAQESTLGMIQYAREQFGDERIIALIAPINSASRNVLVKTGFVYFGTTEYVNPATAEVSQTEIYELPKKA